MQGRGGGKAVGRVAHTVSGVVRSGITDTVIVK